MAFGVLGAYTLSNSTTEVLIMLALGALGFLLRRGDFPIAPVILGVILGPLMESEFRRTLIASDNDLSALVSRPLSIGLICLTVIGVALPYAPVVLARLRRGPRPEARRLAFGEGD
jgi:putative tricarboxylic transport membrane protein